MILKNTRKLDDIVVTIPFKVLIATFSLLIIPVRTTPNAPFPTSLPITMSQGSSSHWSPGNNRSLGTEGRLPGIHT